MRYSNLYFEFNTSKFPWRHEPTPHRNPLRAKVVVILDTGHHLTSHHTDIITLECSVKDFIMNIKQLCVLYVFRHGWRESKTKVQTRCKCLLAHHITHMTNMAPST